MKKLCLSFTLLTGLVQFALAQDNPCIEEGPYYSGWIVESCPYVNNSPSLSPSVFCGEFDAAPCVPTVVAPQYTAGKKYQTTSYDCKDPKTENDSITYEVGEVKWDPPLPGKFGITHVGTFTSTAYVDVSGGDTDCPAPGRYNIGTATWYVSAPPVSVSDSLDLSGYKDALTALARFFAQGNVCDPSGPGSLEATFSREYSSVCCSGCENTTSGSKVKISGGGTFGLGSIECDFPFAGIPFLVTANVHLNASASVSLTIDATVQCSELDRVCGTFSVEGTLGGGVSVIVGHPKLLKAALTLQGSLTPQGEFCAKVSGGYELTGSICASAKIQGTLTTFGGVKKSVNIPLGQWGCS